MIISFKKGKQVTALLELRGGPGMASIMDKIMIWQLMNPKGSCEECCEYVVSKKDEWVFESVKGKRIRIG